MRCHGRTSSFPRARVLVEVWFDTPRQQVASFVRPCNKNHHDQLSVLMRNPQHLLSRLAEGRNHVLESHHLSLGCCAAIPDRELSSLLFVCGHKNESRCCGLSYSIQKLTALIFNHNAGFINISCKIMARTGSYGTWPSVSSSHQ